MTLVQKIRKHFGWYDLHEEGKKWVAKHLGEEYVQEFSDNYVKVNRGITIGGIPEMVVFLCMLDKIVEDLWEDEE